jgi:2-polyprenyl-3-methyl-5-hydroxy-6-metoxy-1,4-benzoquinol methylase
MVDVELDDFMKASAQMNMSDDKPPKLTRSGDCAFHEGYAISTVLMCRPKVSDLLEPCEAGQLINIIRISCEAGSVTDAVDDSYSILRDEFTWSSLSPGSKVVDVGGGSGHLSISLARDLLLLNFVV